MVFDLRASRAPPAAVATLRHVDCGGGRRAASVTPEALLGRPSSPVWRPEPDYSGGLANGSSYRLSSQLAGCLRWQPKIPLL